MRDRDTPSAWVVQGLETLGSTAYFKWRNAPFGGIKEVVAKGC